MRKIFLKSLISCLLVWPIVCLGITWFMLDVVNQRMDLFWITFILMIVVIYVIEFVSFIVKFIIVLADKDFYN